MDTEYKLIQFKVNIKEKFAKLTLSSNKKKVETTETVNRNLENSTAEKRVSRNLMDELMNEKAANTDSYVNPILRTDSSSRNSSDGDVNPNDSMDMEPLQVSFSQPTLKQNENVEDSLSQRISDLTLNANPLSPNCNKEEVSISCASSSYDSDDVITISDSSTQSENYMITSDIPKSGGTADALLPCTFSNDKADRMVAFLRDVSQVRKELESGRIETEETFCHEIDNAHFANVSVAKKLTTAHTESISHDFENHSRHLADETQPMNLTHFSLQSSNVDVATMLKNIHFENREMRLANDETVANTTLSSNKDLSDSISVLSQSKIQLPNDNVDDSFINSSKHSAPPQTSITISETDSEAENLEASLEQINKETALSTESKHIQTTENSSISTELSDIQHSLASINITANIKIKISIIQSTDEDTDSNGSENLRQAKIIPIDSSSEDDDLPRALTEDDGSSNNQRPSNLAADADTVNINEQPSDNNDEDPSFMEHAQKILNQLYGKSWQTPDVIRTLTRTESNQNHKSKSKQSAKKATPKNKTVSPQKINISQMPQEESVLDDFSIFRRNIKTNLDSTRSFDITTATKNKRTPKTNAEEHCKSAARKVKRNIKAPQTEFKSRLPRKGTNDNQRWRQLVDDSDEASYNASDDERADKTVGESDLSSNSDVSWKKSNVSIGSSGSDSETRRKRNTTRTRQNANNDKLVYLDLSKDEIEIVSGAPQTPRANNDAGFQMRLQQVLRSCKFDDKPKLEATPKSHAKSKRKLFTPNFGNEDEEQQEVQPDIDLAAKNDAVLDKENVKINFQQMPAKFEPFNKQLEAIKTGCPIFKIPSPKATPKSKTKISSTKKKQLDCQTSPKETSKDSSAIKDARYTPNNKYGFLKSLDVCVAKSLCHPDALHYRENFRLKKEELAKILYDLYNEKLFKNELQVQLIWNKKLLNTAGRCLNKKRMGTRTSVVELSEKVLTSADRLRCTLIHELCHAATWIFNGEGGHGATWKNWANKANVIFPEIPKIGVCHKYDIEYKYTYKCTLCAAKSHAHSKSKKVENIRCSYCHGAIEVYLNKKDKDGNILPTPVREAKGFAKFVKEKYKEYKRPDLKHADVMKILSNEFSAMKVASAN